MKKIKLAGPSALSLALMLSYQTPSQRHEYTLLLNMLPPYVDGTFSFLVPWARSETESNGRIQNRHFPPCQLGGNHLSYLINLALVDFCLGPVGGYNAPGRFSK